MKFKRHTVVSVLLLSVLIAGSLLPSLVSCKESAEPPSTPPYEYHTVQNTAPLVVDSLWDKPNEVLCLKKDVPMALTEQQSNILCDMILSLMPQALAAFANDRYFNIARFEQWRQESFCVELRYNQRRSYTGNLKTEYEFGLGDSISVQYDAIVLMIRDDVFYVYLYVDDQYYGILDRDVHFLFNGAEDVFWKDVCELLGFSDGDFDVLPKEYKSSWIYSILPTPEQGDNTFLPMPDDMVYCNTVIGDEIPLTKEEQQTIYEAFLLVLANKQEEEQKDPPLLCRCDGTNLDINALIEENGAVEFRYIQPKAMTGRLVTPSGEELLDPHENIENHVVYSTVMIVPHINHYVVFFERNGEYSFFKQINSVFYNYEMMQDYIWLVEGIVQNKFQ